MKKRILLKEKSSIVTHEIISKIPHFRDVITTNYDCLFEKAFKANLNVIFSDNQIPYLDEKKVNLFKIHGDLSTPDSVIITKSDYDDFFGNNRQDDVLWTLIKQKIATKNILFVGYNLEDSNVSVIFDNITKKLGTNRKECFLVSPNIPPQKRNHLFSKNIHYIYSTGEDLFTELIDYLKDNIKHDFEKKNISSEIYDEFIRNFDLKSKIEVNEGSNIVRNITGINGLPETIGKFTIKKEYKDFDKIVDISNGDFFDDLTIDKEAFNEFDVRIGGIKITSLDEIVNLQLKSLPSIDKIVDISFDNGFEIYDVNIKIYRAKSKSKFIITYLKNEFELVIRFMENNSLNFKVDYSNSSLINNVNKQLNFYTAMDLLISNMSFNVYEGGDLLFTSQEEHHSKLISFLSKLKDFNSFYFEYFKKLKVIENYFKLKFSKIEVNEITEENDSYLDNIIAKYEKKPLEISFEGISC